MKKIIGTLMLAAGLAVVAQGQTIFDNTAGSYSVGNLTNQNNWTALQNTETNGVPFPVGQSNQLGQVAFNVDNASWVDTVGTDSDFLTTTNGSFVYLNEASAGNADDQVWTTTMDFNFSIPDGGAAGIAMPNAEFFYVGLTASTTNGLSEFDRNDLCFVLRTRAENGRLDVNFQSGDQSDKRILQIKPENIGWAPEAVMDDGTAVTADYQTDDLRLIMTTRKTRNADTYTASAIITNLNTGFSFNGLELVGPTTNRVVESSYSTNFYNAADVKVAHGRSSQAYNDQIGGLIDIDIDALSVVTSSVPPAITAPSGVAASPYDAQVTFSWDSVAEAGSYDVFRSETSDSYGAALTNVTGTSLLDTTVVNDTTYYYVVQSVFPGLSNSTNSLEASGTPQAIFTGTLVDTNFIGYANADLAGQEGWKQVLGSSNNAFNVINSGTSDSAIDTVSTAANFSTNTGNAVYLDKLMDNLKNDAWEGSIDFVVSAEASSGTNVALISNQSVLAFGVTSDKDAPLILSGGANDQMALMSLLVRANGKLVALFGEDGNDADDTRLAVLIGNTETGWDPDNPAAPDLVSDPIRYSWKIRKTTVDGEYQATATLSNLVSGAFGDMQTIVPYSLKTKQTMYDSPASNFAMGHYYKAKLAADTELVNVTIQDMNVTHTADNLPEISAPGNVDTIGGDRSVSITWDVAYEADDYDVLFAETSGGDQITVAGGLTALTYLDSPRFNGVPGYYTVRANFPSDSDDSEEKEGTPIALITQINIDGLGSDSTLISSSVNLDQTTGLQTNVGNEVTYIDYSSTPFVTSSMGGWSAAPMYGLSQVNTIEPDITSAKGTTGYRIRQGGAQVINGTQSDHFEFTTAGTQAEALWYVKSTDFAEPSASIDLTVDTHTVVFANQISANDKPHRIAIRNGDTWYVSQTHLLSGTLAAPDQTTIANLYADAWAEVTITPGTWFTDPGTFDTSNNDSFTNVNAIGWFCVGITKWKPYQLIYSSSGSIPSYEYWAGNNGLTNGIDGATDDPDGDGKDNAWEYGLGGDPLDGNDVGALQVFAEEGGGFSYVHNELRDPNSGITYTVETTDDLVIGTLGTNTSVAGTANIDYYWKSVTNSIPADLDAKFIQLQVE
ncbi:hypothetical protein [Pontiella sulfatireligans]|uniref:Fibronectin type-III domain-containing protein n=1 Tax=Pontiella sulfatireligans TaxID=2750658 RepID=A0A6C2UQ05_9BACT|nr:hypothetical protein [Pontiella sulfatireligans]VGO22288.1 hypothetical protein SCARR_04370 [Pontiella sulfatireligans]